MKPSGIEWIGDIPDDWEVKKVKRLFSYQKGKNAALLTKEYISLHPGEYPVLSGQTENDGILGYYESYEFDLDKDSIFVTTVGAKAMSTKLVNAKFSLSQNCALLHKIDEKADVRFLHYALFPMFEWQKSMISLIMQPSLRFEDLDKATLPYPPLKTQERIADYLDEKCGEIDATIAKQKESIEKLKAYKQSLISETVTKGLDKSAPLKPSGIDYLGDIPAHWEVKRIKELFSFGKGLPISKEDLIENGVPVINYGQIHSKDNNGTSIKDSLIRYVDLNYKNTNMTSLVESGDFIFADTSEDLDGCGNCIYVDSKYPIFAGYHCIILRSIKRNSSKYLAYLFQMDAWRTQIRRDVTGVKVFSISKKILGKSYILFPPRYEQECIVNYLQEKCNEIDVIINKKQNIIQKLDAYKKSLIFECVTGKQKI